MRFLSSTLFCLGGLAACSHQPEATTAYDASNANAQPEASTSDVPPRAASNTVVGDGATSAPVTATPATQYRPAAADTSGNASAANGTTANPSNTQLPRSNEPDNTATNKRDSDGASVTPMDQRENAADLKITQQIRQAVMANDSLSFTAKNVKIITINGNVTLRGPVNSAAERGAIENAARQVPGILSVDNQLEVKK